VVLTLNFIVILFSVVFYHRLTYHIYKIYTSLI